MINQESTEADSNNHSTTKRVWKKIVVFLLALIILGILGIWEIRRWSEPLSGRTNFLVLGRGSQDHQAADLTDTVIFASLENKTGRMLLLSIPRDVWLPDLKTKVNSVYHYQGLPGSKKAVSGILGQPVDYGVVIDFNGFVRVIDVLGGIEVQIERSFDDYRYPIAGKENDFCDGDPEYKCRYEHLHFEAGKELMDGERALKFVRSRYAEGEEGSDFARSRRQQQVLLAVKNRLLSSQFILKPQKISALVEVIRQSVETDLPPEKYLDLLKSVLRFRSTKIQTAILDNGFWENPPEKKYNGQWVLFPKNGNWEEIQSRVKSLLGN